MQEQNTPQVRGMVCPIDGAPLNMTDRQGVEIDYCPKCRGIWLDRGELDKIIEKSFAETSRQDPRGVDDRDYDPRYSGSGGHHGGGQRGRRRGSFLGDLFDF